MPSFVPVYAGYAVTERIESLGYLPPVEEILSEEKAKVDAGLHEYVGTELWTYYEEEIRSAYAEQVQAGTGPSVLGLVRLTLGEPI